MLSYLLSFAKNMQGSPFSFTATTVDRLPVPLPLGVPKVKVAHSAQDWRRAKEAHGREHGLGAGSEKKEPQTPESHTRVFLSSLRREEKSRSTQAAREHRSIENRNHHKRDASAWQEDRHRRPRAALDLALTRNALLAIIPSQQGEPLAHFFELYHRYPAKALNLILQARPVL